MVEGAWEASPCLLESPLYYPQSFLDFHLQSEVLRNIVWKILNIMRENDKSGNYMEL